MPVLDLHGAVMRVFVLMAGVLCLAAFSSAQTSAQSAAIVSEVSSDVMGDWRRHEIVRSYRDDAGCQLVIINYHHTDGGVDVRENRDCSKF
ncbi:hypothetical protein GGD83_003919 [Rhodoblastus sphagnicola]|nr:hypothetical protein [Rhodoblastus sphagnicola]MBB4200092.1 hypothetical protein [Rhodoblastus sphagnicola]